MLKKIHIELKWAINFGIAFLLWMIIEKSSGLHDRRISDYIVYTNVFVLITVGLYFVALLDKKKNVYQGRQLIFQIILIPTLVVKEIVIHIP
jgi:hypothetical protein